MLKEAFEWIASHADTEEWEIGGRRYTSAPVHLVHEPTAKPIELSSLSSFATYVTENRDELELSRCQAIVSAQSAVLRGPLSTQDRSREKLVIATVGDAFCDSGAGRYGQFIPRELFQIALTSCFAESQARAVLVDAIQGITAGETREFTDDGVVQQSVVKKEAGVKKRTDLDPIVALAPFRTFREIDQPTSKFLFRIKDDGEHIHCALFEADGGAWKLEAAKSAAAYLQKAFAELEFCPSILF